MVSTLQYHQILPMNGILFAENNLFVQFLGYVNALWGIFTNRVVMKCD